MSREVGVRDTVAKARLGYIVRSLSQSNAVKHHKDVSLALLCTSPSSVILVLLHWYLFLAASLSHAPNFFKMILVQGLEKWLITCSHTVLVEMT